MSQFLPFFILLGLFFAGILVWLSGTVNQAAYREAQKRGWKIITLRKKFVLFASYMDKNDVLYEASVSDSEKTFIVFFKINIVTDDVTVLNPESPDSVL